MTWHNTGAVYDSGVHVYDGIAWIGDTIGHRFERPEDWPELPATIIEHANLPHRADYRCKVATHSGIGPWLGEVYAKHDAVRARMAVVAKARRGPRRTVSARFGLYWAMFVPSPDGAGWEGTWATANYHDMETRGRSYAAFMDLPIHD